jgi:hypothetical protein
MAERLPLFINFFFTAMPDQSGRTILCCSSGGANCVPHQTSAEISDRIGWRGKQVGSAALARAKLVQGARAVESPGFFFSADRARKQWLGRSRIDFFARSSRFRAFFIDGVHGLT